MKNKITLINTISTILLQLVTVVSGFVVPKLILNSFGSEINGLVLSLNQFLNYISLIEGGVNGVIMASLYKPLVQKDHKKVSSIVRTSDKFFKKISLILIIYSIGLAVIYPLVMNTGLSWDFVFTLAMILSVKLLVQYCFSLSLRNLLNADKKVYYVSFTQIILLVADMVSAILVVKFFPDIRILKLISAAIFILQPLIYNTYIKKHYNLDKNAPIDKTLLANRWDGLAINTAAFIHSNTDITIISIIRGLKEASVYGTYALISNGLKTFCQSLWKALGPSIGKLYASGNTKELNEKLDVFEYVTMALVAFLFSIAILLATPFVMIYTDGVVDADYYQPIFGVILLCAEAMYIIREPYVNLAYGANKFKDLRLCAIIEASLNIVISLVLVPFLGLIGVAIGTLIAMTYRTIYQVYYLKNHLINRPFKKFVNCFLKVFVPSILVTVLCALLLPMNDFNIGSWFKYALIYGAIMTTTQFIIGTVFFRRYLIYIKKYIKKEKK